MKFEHRNFACSKENVNEFHIVLIDAGENRANLSKILVDLNYRGIVIIDNAEWYRNSVNIFLSVGYLEIPFFGIKPVHDHVCSTSLLIQASDFSKVFKSDWKKIPKFSSYRTTNKWDEL